MRLLATLAALLALAACVAPAHAGAATPSPPMLAMYLRGFLDGATPAGWRTISATCKRETGRIACTATAASSTGKRECFHATFATSGAPTALLRRAACPKKSTGPAS